MKKRERKGGGGGGEEGERKESVRRRDFDRDWVDSIGQFGKCCHLSDINILIYEHGISFYLFRFSLISLNSAISFI